MNTNDHHVSQVLLRQFASTGRLNCYDVQSDQWKLVAPKNVFSHTGYNQLLIDGNLDVTLEQNFGRIETHLPKTFKALNAAAHNSSTELPTRVYENICWYCAYLNRISLFAKAAAPAEFVMDLNAELEEGKGGNLLQSLNASPGFVARLRKERALGRWIIIDSKGYLQVIYRIQFRRHYADKYAIFRHCTNWTICTSPIELPLADVALLELPSHREILYLLPIAPKLLLKGLLRCGVPTSFSHTKICGTHLSATEAQHFVDVICLAAVRELICSRVIADVPTIRTRAKRSGVAFHKIIDPDSVLSAGRHNFTAELGLRAVSLEEYKKFIGAFVQAP